ncbi:ATP-dependent nuclease [Mycobacterium kansasii]
MHVIGTIRVQVIGTIRDTQTTRDEADRKLPTERMCERATVNTPSSQHGHQLRRFVLTKSDTVMVILSAEPRAASPVLQLGVCAGLQHDPRLHASICVLSRLQFLPVTSNATEPIVSDQDDAQLSMEFEGYDVERERVPSALIGPPPPARPDDAPPIIRRVWLKNFKGFEEFEASFGRFNVLVGANNAGKSTLLQAVDLLFSLLKLHAEGERLGSGGRLIPSSILPVASLRDIFYKGHWRIGNEYVYATVGAEFSDKSHVEFGLRRMFGGGNSRIRHQSGMEGNRLQRLLSRPTIWVPSAVGIVRDEEYRTSARRAGLISAGRQNEVLRNLLVALKEEQQERFSLLQRILSERFHGHLSEVNFDDTLDQYVSTRYADESGTSHDLYSAGAGFIQVVQLLAFILTRDASVVLLDEPDAHLHSSLQRVIVEILDEIAEQQTFQVVLATHSKEIINFVDPTRLILVEAGAKEAAPVSADVTPVTILRSLGAIDNVDAFTLVRNRRCLFVEGPTDITILGRFAATIGVHVFTGDERVVPVPTGGADKFEHVQQLDVLEAVLGGPLKSLELRDRDARLTEARSDLMANAQRPLHVFTLDCIESYLLNPAVIARVIYEIADERGKELSVSSQEIGELILNLTEGLKDSTVDRAANRYTMDAIKSGARPSVATVNPIARQAVADAWPALEDRLTLVSGKQLLSDLRRAVQDQFGLNFGNERLAEAFRPEEIPPEIRDVLLRVESLRDGVDP